MLLRKDRDFNRLLGTSATCPYCNKRVYSPPAIYSEKSRTAYHIPCIMELIYMTLADLSGQTPKIELKEEELSIH